MVGIKHILVISVTLCVDLFASLSATFHCLFLRSFHCLSSVFLTPYQRLTLVCSSSAYLSVIWPFADSLSRHCTIYHLFLLSFVCPSIGECLSAFLPGGCHSSVYLSLHLSVTCLPPHLSAICLSFQLPACQLPVQALLSLSAICPSIWTLFSVCFYFSLCQKTLMQCKNWWWKMQILYTVRLSHF